mmetsp:Transcript_10737/g.14008  ORF Transcript_10737/g.14008 Transcript_10737/m.14008 type:complete len:133 (+) Transcript_10737:178-576(+)
MFLDTCNRKKTLSQTVNASFASCKGWLHSRTISHYPKFSRGSTCTCVMDMLPWSHSNTFTSASQSYMDNVESLSNSYFFSRIVFLRALGFVYCAAFLIAFFQNRGLIGDNGISPAKDKLDEAERRGLILANV